MARHYHVLAGLRGCYMPDTNDVYPTLAEAREGAKRDAEAWGEVHEWDVECISPDYYVIDHFSVEVHECDSLKCEVSND